MKLKKFRELQPSLYHPDGKRKRKVINHEAAELMLQIIDQLEDAVEYLEMYVNNRP